MSLRLDHGIFSMGKDSFHGIEVISGIAPNQKISLETIPQTHYARYRIDDLGADWEFDAKLESVRRLRLAAHGHIGIKVAALLPFGATAPPFKKSMTTRCKETVA